MLTISKIGFLKDVYMIDNVYYMHDECTKFNSCVKEPIALVYNIYNSNEHGTISHQWYFNGNKLKEYKFNIPKSDWYNAITTMSWIDNEIKCNGEYIVVIKKNGQEVDRKIFTVNITTCTTVVVPPVTNCDVKTDFKIK